MYIFLTLRSEHYSCQNSFFLSFPLLISRNTDIEEMFVGNWHLFYLLPCVGESIPPEFLALYLLDILMARILDWINCSTKHTHLLHPDLLLIMIKNWISIDLSWTLLSTVSCLSAHSVQDCDSLLKMIDSPESKNRMETSDWVEWQDIWIRLFLCPFTVCIALPDACSDDDASKVN